MCKQPVVAVQYADGENEPEINPVPGLIITIKNTATTRSTSTGGCTLHVSYIVSGGLAVRALSLSARQGAASATGTPARVGSGQREWDGSFTLPLPKDRKTVRFSVLVTGYQFEGKPALTLPSSKGRLQLRVTHLPES